MELPTETASKLVTRWLNASSFKKDKDGNKDALSRWLNDSFREKEKIANYLAQLSITHLLQFTYMLQTNWEAEGKGGFNHEIDLLSIFLEKESKICA
jgi:hypothetical protein